MRYSLKLKAIAAIVTLSSTVVFAHGTEHKDCDNNTDEVTTNHTHGHNTSSVKHGDIELNNGSSRAMLPAQKVGGGYITIKNHGRSDDRLISATSTSAGRVEIHEMAMDNDVMKMRKLNDGINIAAGETVELKSGGFHLMFFDVHTPFASGDEIPVTLVFENAGAVDVVLHVNSSKNNGHSHH